MQSTLVRSLVFPWLLALLLLSLGPTPVTQAAVNLNVDRFDDPVVTVGGVGAAACTPVEDDCSLRGAILFTNASLGDAFVINIPTGTYTLTLTGAGEDNNLTGDLDITHPVTIAGAGASDTIINANNLDRVLDARTDNIRISGVTIKGGHAPDGAVATSIVGGGPGENGGGIRNTASLTLTNVIVTANQAGAGGDGAAAPASGTAYPGGLGGMGGGIYNIAALTIMSTTISSNGAGNGGVGGSGSATASSHAGAIGGNGGDAGGIFNSGALTVTASILQSNHAGSGGNGGAGSMGGPSILSGAAGGSGGNGGNGGGIYNGGSTIIGDLSLAGTTVAGNVTGNGGNGGAGGDGRAGPMSGVPGGAGGAAGAGGKGGNGSAISNTARATVTNSTLSGNTAGNGGPGANGGTGGKGYSAPGGNGGDGGNGGNGGFGGIYNYNSLPVTAMITVTSATITANNAGNSGSPGSGGLGGVGTPSGNYGWPGAIGTVGSGGGVVPYGGTLSLKNTILANNTTPPFGQGPDCYGMLNSQGFNLIRTVTSCTVGGPTIGDITGQDPLLNALADNGGGTLTHAFLFTSPARNAADPAGCNDAAGTLLLVDQRGLPRSFGGRCDIGAYELQSSDLFLPLLRR